MASPGSDDHHDSTPAPFLLRLFYRTGAFHRPDEFSGRDLPAHLQLYVQPTDTMYELALSMLGEDSSIFPYPAIGTRLCFRLIYPDARLAHGPPRFVIKDLGSLVIGAGRPGAETEEDDAESAADEQGTASKTLSDVKFVVGDYISCAILPPLPSGDVAPASHAKTGRGAGIGEGRAAPSAPSIRGENGFGSGSGQRGGWGRRDVGAGGGGTRSSVPMGEWRRGERLPDAPPNRGRGRGAKGGRWH